MNKAMSKATNNNNGNKNIDDIAYQFRVDNDEYFDDNSVMMLMIIATITKTTASTEIKGIEKHQRILELQCK